MSDPRPEDPAEGTPAPAARQTSEAVERRDFLRQLTGEAVVTSARLAGLSAAVRRSLFAAGEAAVRDLDPPGEGSPPAMASDASAAVPAAPAPTGGTPAAASPSERAIVALSPRQQTFLMKATSAILGTNDPAGGPHLTSSTFYWEGTTVRLPSDLFAARVARIDADPRVSVLIADDTSDGWVAMRGTAGIVSGDAVEAEMLPILRKHMTDEEAQLTWMEMRSSGEPVVIAIRPSSYVWRLD